MDLPREQQSQDYVKASTTAMASFIEQLVEHDELVKMLTCNISHTIDKQSL